MANWNTGVTASLTAVAHTTAFTFTIPAGVATNDVMLINIEVFTQPGSSNSFGTPTSGGGSWTQVGSTLTATYNGTDPCYGFVFRRVATASDPSSTFSMSYTGTTPSPDQLWWAGDMEAYTGFYTASPIGNVATTTNVNGTTITAPSTTTTAAGSWEVDTCPVAISASSTYSSEPLTNRHTVTTQGISSAVSDSNGSVGASGTSIGGGSWVLQATCNSSGMAFTVELRTAAPGGTNGTVQPLATFPAPRRVAARAALGPARGVWASVIGPSNQHGPSGTVQPRPTIQVPRRAFARAVWTGPAIVSSNAAAAAGPSGLIPAMMVNRTEVISRVTARVVRH